MGRPRKEISEAQVESLAAINCSYAEIAAVVGCDVSMLNRRFKQVIENGRDQGKSSLKRKMWDIAINKGNVTMCIWLSKQMLGYTDKVEQNVSAQTQTNIVYNTQFGPSNADIATVQSTAHAAKSSSIEQKV